MKHRAEPETWAARELRTSVANLPAGSRRWAIIGVAAGGERDGRGQRDCTRRIAEREVVLLDGQDVGEVGLELDGELDRHRVAGQVGDDHVLLQVVGDEALAAEQDLVRQQPSRRRVAQEEGRREVLDLAGRERQRAHAVDRREQPREKSRVVRVEPVRPLEDGALVARRCRTSSRRGS